MANITITQLPTAGALTGSELVPIVQNGVTVQTTTGAVSGAGALNYPFLTVGSTAGLTQARYMNTSTGLSLTDSGAGGTLTINMTGTAASLNSASTGFVVKDSASTVTNRQITVGSGMTVSNGDGVSGNPVIGLSQLLQNISSTTAVGLLTVNGNTVTATTIVGTTNQISVTNGNGIAGSPTVGLSSNPVVPGTASITVPTGTTAQRVGTTNGQLRYNTDTATFEGYANGVWGSITTGTGVTSVATGTGLTGGPITSTGTISIDNTVVATLTDTQTLTNKTISGASNTLSNIGNSSLTNSSITINGSLVSLGGSITVTATASNALTIGTGLSGTSYDGSAPVTIAIDSTVATLTGSQTLTNKSMSGSSNTFTNLPNSALTNSSITLGTTTIALGATSLAPAGLTSVTVTQDPTTAFQLATKQYVDGLASTGLYYHLPVQVATTQDLATQTGGLVVYNNGASGVGATLTLTVALTTLDGYSLVNGDRILVKNETNQAYNGVYTWATGGLVLTRSTDTDTYGTGTGDLSENDYFFVQNGTVNKGTSYVCTTAGTITFGTTAITFAQFSTSQVYTGSSPIQVSGTVISLNTVPVASGGTNITSYATGDMLYASGSTTLAKLTIGTANYVLTSSGTAPQYVAQSTLSVGSATTATTATNATNTAITANSTNADYYITVVSANTGNLPQLVATGLTANPSTGKITSGVSGGTF